MQKRATLTAVLRRAEKMASDEGSLVKGGLAKIEEFRRLRYPISVLKQACSYLAASSGRPGWLAVRDTLR